MLIKTNAVSAEACSGATVGIHQAEVFQVLLHLRQAWILKRCQENCENTSTHVDAWHGAVLKPNAGCIRQHYGFFGANTGKRLLVYVQHSKCLLDLVETVCKLPKIHLTTVPVDLQKVAVLPPSCSTCLSNGRAFWHRNFEHAHNKRACTPKSGNQ